MQGVGSPTATITSPVPRAHRHLELVRARVLLVALGVAVGLAVVVPVLALARDAVGGATLPRAFDEDAYYTFSVARNLAEGKGLTADGAQLTSGVQPLWTVGVAPAFLLPGRAPFVVVAGVAAAIWVASAAVLGRIVARALAIHGRRRAEAVLLASFVFLVDPNLRSLYFNGLETGLALLLLLVILDRFVVVPPERSRAGEPAHDVRFGVALGLLLLARVDAVLVVAALLVARIVVQRPSRRLGVLVLPGVVAALLVLPWLLYSLAATGSLLPQGGAATSGGIYRLPVGDHLQPALQAVTSWLWWPRPWRGAPAPLGAVPAALLACAALALWRSRQLPAGATRVLGLLVVAATGTGAAYVVASSAFWFYGRYFVVLRLCVLLVLATALVAAFDRRGSVLRGAVAGLVATAVTVLVLVTEPRPAPYLYAETESIATSTALGACGRIGMFESGRTGFAFPDRVVNLDGKTNLAALEAFRDDRLLAYVAEERLDVLVVRPGWPELLLRHGEDWTATYDVVADPRGTDASFLVRRGSPCAAAMAAVS